MKVVEISEGFHEGRSCLWVKLDDGRIVAYIRNAKATDILGKRTFLDYQIDIAVAEYAFEMQKLADVKTAPIGG